MTFSLRAAGVRKFLVPSVIAAVGYAIVVNHAGGVAAAHRNAIEATALPAEFEELCRERARLERRAVYIADRIAIKVALVEDLIAGRQTLLDVAERFEDMNGDEPDAAVIRRHFRGDSDLERNANNVLGYAEQRVPDPSERARLMGKLAAEYCHHFGHPVAY